MSGGGSKTQTVGYWYKYLQAFTLSLGKLDAVLEFRAGGRTAWRGIVTQTSRIYVNALNLWGGQKKEGGLLGYMDLQMGDADQQPNDYLAAQLGSDQPSYRGKAMAIWRGGRWGAMNPYPKRAEFKVRRILQGWDNDTPWYPEKAELKLSVVPGSKIDWRYKVVPNSDAADYSSPAYDDSGWPLGAAPFADEPWAYPGTFGFSTVPGTVVAEASKVWMRTRVYLAAVPETMRFQAFVDNDCIIYVNGVQVVQVGAHNGAYYDQEIDTDAFVVGQNTVVAVGWDRHSGAGNYFYFDWRLESSSDTVAMNAAHVLYDSLTAKDMQGEPTALVNDASFRAAADVLYGEGLGVCTTYDFDESIEEFQARILNVIGASMTQSREDGQYYLDLIRPTEDPDTLPVISSDDIISLTLEPSTITEQVNQLTAEWFDVENNVARSTPPMQSRGAIHAAGQVNGETVEYPEIAAESLCMRLQARDLAAKSTPLTKVTVTTNRRGDLWKLRPGKKVRLQSAEDGVDNMIVVVGDIEYGTQRDGRMKIQGVQDVYSMPATTYVVAQPNQGQPIYSPPVPSPAQRLIEAPYVEVAANLSAADLAAFPNDAGAIMAMAIEPSGGLNYSLYSASDGVDLEDNGTGEWCPSALIVEAAGYLDTAFTLTDADRLDLVAVGSWALWDDEIVRIDAIDEDALTVTLGRGCADTVPWKHEAGSRIWFCGDWGSTDGLQYLDGDTVNAALLTRTSIDELPLASATALSVEMSQRWFRPYPPAGLLIGGTAYPDEVIGDVAVTWVGRDRVMQSDQLFDTSAAAIGPESGVTYNVRCYVNDTLDTELLDTSSTSFTWTPSTTAGVGQVAVSSVRGGLESLQALTAEFSLGEPLEGDPHWDNVVSLLQFDDPANPWKDETGRVWAPSGDISYSGEGRFSGCALTSSMPAFLTTEGGSEFSPAAQGGKMTIEFFLKPSPSDSSRVKAILSARGGSSLVNTWVIERAATGRMDIGIFNSSGTAAVYATSGENLLPPGVWTHCAFVVDVTEVRVYVGGVGSSTPAPSLPATGAWPIQLLRSPAAPDASRNFVGAIDTLRITKGVARYTENFTPPTAPFPHG